jgi:hypothetical protein
MAPVYKPRPPKSTVKVQAYLSPKVREAMMQLGRLWAILDRHSPQETNAEEWTESEILKRLIESGIDAAWDEVKGGAPQSEEGWAALEQAIARAARRPDASEPASAVDEPKKSKR